MMCTAHNVNGNIFLLLLRWTSLVFSTSNLSVGMGSAIFKKMYIINVNHFVMVINVLI